VAVKTERVGTALADRSRGRSGRPGRLWVGVGAKQAWGLRSQSLMPCHS
jgi:hypothetical protein